LPNATGSLPGILATLFSVGCNSHKSTHDPEIRLQEFRGGLLPLKQKNPSQRRGLVPFVISNSWPLAGWLWHLAEQVAGRSSGQFLNDLPLTLPLISNATSILCLVMSIPRIGADIRQKKELLASVPGIGKVTIAVILAELDNLEKFNHVRELVPFIGLAPKETLSGS